MTPDRSPQRTVDPAARALPHAVIQVNCRRAPELGGTG